jgi:putative SOS response-associated peptidase YedK
MAWGLIPWWSKEPKLKYATFNAKEETVSTMASFRDAWNNGKRCLVVTDGFYEWRKPDKQPFAIACRDGALTVMAGLWDTWRSPGGEKINSCTIITAAANEMLAPLHDRMPVILTPTDWPQWLGEAPATEAELKALLRPHAGDDLHLWPVSKRVGSVKNNDASLSEPVSVAA